MVAFIVAFTVGCPGGLVDDPLSQILVESAHLDEVSLSNVGVIVGGGSGEALLVVDDTDGERHEFPSTLGTRDVGLLLDASFLVTFDGDIPFTLPETQLTARELIGLYSGPHVGGNPIVGAHWREVKHITSGASLTMAAWSVGVGVVPLAWEDLTLLLVDDPLRFLPAPPGPGFCAVDEDCALDEFCNEIVLRCEPTRIDEARAPRPLPRPSR